MDVKIVIAVNKKDVWFCRICVASIRYYYPDVEIYLLKDELNGKFSTKEIEQYWKVRLIEFSVKRFGWSGSKMHFYCDERFKNQKFLVLDCDIVFIGNLLDEAFVKEFDGDVIVSENRVGDPESDWFTRTYFNYNTIKEYDPGYSFDGYVFNCGQLFCKGNFIDKALMEPYFDFEDIPSWKRPDIFPLVDQSVFNYLFPRLDSEGNLKIGKADYMLWSESDIAKKIELKLVETGGEYPFLVHWAGALRIPHLSKMTRSDILCFFESFYYAPVKLGSLLRRTRKTKSIIKYYLRNSYHEIKKIVKLLNPSMVNRLSKVIKREKFKYPGKSATTVLKNRVIQITRDKLGRLIMSFKKDSTFISIDDLFMCSLFPQKVLDIVIDEIKPKSVLDVGCGVGNSLQYYLSNGIDAWGIENSPVAISHSSVKERIIKHNLKRQLNLNKQFDLVWCFEVIEHIHPDYESDFLSTLINHSAKILISAARPGQGGHGHFNEKEPEYWIAKFSNRGYKYNEEFTLKVKSTMETHSANLLFFIKD